MVYTIATEIVEFINGTEQPNNQLEGWELDEAIDDCIYIIESFVKDKHSRNFSDIKQYYFRLLEEGTNGNAEAFSIIADLSAYIADNI